MAIFRGIGGAGDSTTDATVTAVTEQATNAANSATAAASSASSASTSASAAAASASAAASSAAVVASAETNVLEDVLTSAANAAAAASSATAAASSASDAASSASDAQTAQTAAEAAESNASTSASAASSSASSASSSASTATTQATNAASSASAAATSATNAANSATTASGYVSDAADQVALATTQATNAANSATAASTSASSAASSAAAAAASLDSFDDRYLGAKSSAPTLDNDGNALVTGALYYDTTEGSMFVYDGGQWIAASSASQAILTVYKYTATSGQTTFSGVDDNAATLGYTVGSIIVTLNGVFLESGDDYTATNGSSVVLSAGATTSDEVNIYSFNTFDVANVQVIGDERYVRLSTDQTVAGTKTLSSNPVLSAGTANGVTYLNGSKVLTSGSYLTSDGTNLALGGSASAFGGGVSTLTLKGTGATNTKAGAVWFKDAAGSDAGAHFLQDDSSYGFTSWNAMATGNFFRWAIGALGSEAMRLTSTGLGIGTSSLGAKLHVIGDQIRHSNSGNASYYGTFAHDAVSTAANIYNSQDTGGHLFQNSGSTVLTLNNSGNLGLGVTPSAWVSTYKAFQMGGGSLISFNGNDRILLAMNTYLNSSGNYAYVGSTYASGYNQVYGGHEWYTAPSGTAGNTISFTQAMTLTAGGRLGIATTSPLYDLQVADTSANISIGGAPTSNGTGRLKFINSTTQKNFQIGFNDHVNGALEFSRSTAAGGSTFSTPDMVIDSSGNLLVGTTSSNGRKLRVYGSGDLVELVSTNSGLGGAQIDLKHESASPADGDIVGLINFGGYDSGNNSTNYASIYGVASSVSSETGELRFGTRTNSSTYNSSAMVITSAGSVGIGTTSPAHRIDAINTAGSASARFGSTFNTGANNGTVIITNGGTGDAMLRFDYEGTNTDRARIGVTASNQALQFFTAGNNERMRIDSDGNLDMTGGGCIGRTANSSGIAFGGNSVLPSDASNVADNSKSLGSSAWRWSVVYAGTGTINTSDANLKQDIVDLDNAEKRVATRIKTLIKKFRFKESVIQKGDNARIHVGVIAQDIQSAFVAEGLDPNRYALFCSDTWVDEKTNEEKTRLGIRYEELLAFVISAI